MMPAMARLHVDDADELVHRERTDDRREPAVDERAQDLPCLLRGADGPEEPVGRGRVGIFHVTDASTASVLSTVPVMGSRVSDSTAGRSNDCTRRSIRWTESTGHGALMCRPAAVAPSWMTTGSPNRVT